MLVALGDTCPEARVEVVAGVNRQQPHSFRGFFNPKEGGPLFGNQVDRHQYLAGQDALVNREDDSNAVLQQLLLSLCDKQGKILRNTWISEVYLSPDGKVLHDVELIIGEVELRHIDHSLDWVLHFVLQKGLTRWRNCLRGELLTAKTHHYHTPRRSVQEISATFKVRV